MTRTIDIDLPSGRWVNVNLVEWQPAEPDIGIMTGGWLWNCDEPLTDEESDQVDRVVARLDRD